MTADGKEDVEVMRSYYEKAEKIIVFSGDFSWITTHEEIRKLLVAMGDRVTYVSYKSEAAVREKLGDLYEALKTRFRFDGPPDLKCSMVWYSAEQVFLYKTVAPGKPVKSAVCVLSPQMDSRYLLRALEILVQQAAKT